MSIGTTEARPLLHDYGGFAPALRNVTYDAPAAAELGDHLERALREKVGTISGGALGSIHRSAERAWDHGVWVPLLHLFPRAEVPVLQVSLASGTAPEALFAFGEHLREVLDPRALIVGSGGAVHNLGRLDWQESTATENWALDFDEWLRGALKDRDIDALINFKERAPALHLAHPTLEHWLPVLIAAGAGKLGEQERESVLFPVRGFEYGNLGRLGFEIS